MHSGHSNWLSYTTVYQYKLNLLLPHNIMTTMLNLWPLSKQIHFSSFQAFILHPHFSLKYQYKFSICYANFSFFYISFFLAITHAKANHTLNWNAICDILSTSFNVFKPTWKKVIKSDQIMRVEILYTNIFTLVKN